METAYFDATSTSTCTGSPILVTYTQDPCMNRWFEVTNGGLSQTCSPSVDGHYTWQWASCDVNRTTVDISKWRRNYVIEERFMQSDTCNGAVAQAFAIAADYMCHALPMTIASSMHTQLYAQVNCNDKSPIWKTCWDADCTNCTVVEYGNSPCKLNGAGTSTRVRCLNAELGGNGTNTDPTPPSAPITLLPTDVVDSAASATTRGGWPFITLTIVFSVKKIFGL